MNHKIFSWQKFIIELLITAVIIVVLSAKIFAAELFGPMEGFYWVVGSAERFNEVKILQDIDKTLSNNKYLSGIFIGATWKDIEPESGKYSWGLLDKEIQLAHKYKKYYKLVIYPGANSPEWIYREGCQAFTMGVANKYRSNFGENIKVPIPWDTIYLNNFNRLIKKVSERYSNDPYLVAIAITGANAQSAEMHFVKGKQEIKRLEQYGNFRTKLVEVYKSLIDSFAQNFPHQQLCLHIAMPVNGMEREVRTIIEYGIKKYPKQFTIQSCQLNGRRDNSQLFSYRMITDYKNLVHHGFQSLAGWSHSQERQGSMEMAILNYIRVGSQYWELWRGDGMSKEICAQLKEKLEAAEKLGYEKYKEQLIKE